MATGKVKSQELPPQVQIDWTVEPPALFVNYATIAAAQEEFALVLCAISPGDPATVGTSKQKIIRARPVSSIRMTPGTFWKVLMAMGTTWNKFVGNDTAMPRVTFEKPKEAE